MTKEDMIKEIMNILNQHTDKAIILTNKNCYDLAKLILEDAIIKRGMIPVTYRYPGFPTISSLPMKFYEWGEDED